MVAIPRGGAAFTAGARTLDRRPVGNPPWIRRSHTFLVPASLRQRPIPRRWDAIPCFDEAHPTNS